MLDDTEEINTLTLHDIKTTKLVINALTNTPKSDIIKFFQAAKLSNVRAVLNGEALPVYGKLVYGWLLLASKNNKDKQWLFYDLTKLKKKLAVLAKKGYTAVAVEVVLGDEVEGILK